MAKFSLIPFDLSLPPKIHLDVELNSTLSSLFISFKLTGDIKNIDLDHGTPKHERIIGLWEKTCFELFFKNERGEYFEFNFSPVFEWNAFYFEKKGAALKEYQALDSLKLDILHSLDVFLLIAEIDKTKIPESFFKGEIMAGITSVIKETNGELSYWALSHADQKPNFHHFDSFKCKF